MSQATNFLSKITTHCCQKVNLTLLLILFGDESLIHKIQIEVLRSNSTKSIDFCEFLMVIQKYLALRLPQRIIDVTIIPNNDRIHITWRAQRVIFAGLEGYVSSTLFINFGLHDVGFRYVNKDIGINKRSRNNQFIQKQW